MQLGPKGGAAAGGNLNYAKPAFGGHEPEMLAKQDEIPVIEENYTPPADDESIDPKTVSFEDSAADEIDVKDIPF